MKKFFKILGSIIVFGILTYYFIQFILVILLIPTFFIFDDVGIYPVMLYVKGVLCAIVLSFFLTKELFFSKNSKNK